MNCVFQACDWLMTWLCPMKPQNDDPFDRPQWRPRKRVTFHPLVIVRPFRRDSQKPMRPTPRRVNGARGGVR